MEKEAKEVKNLADTLFDDNGFNRRAGAILRLFFRTALLASRFLIRILLFGYIKLLK